MEALLQVITLITMITIKLLIVWGVVTSANHRNRCAACWGIAALFFGLLAWLPLVFMKKLEVRA